MAVQNTDVARIFDEVADLLDITGAGYFRVRAYRNAARVIRDLGTPLELIYRDPDKKLEDLPGIGRDLASKIQEIIETGDLGLRNELEQKLPVGLLDVMKIPGIGPRKAHTLFLELGVSDVESLGEAAKNHRIRRLRGFGQKTENNILEGIYSMEVYGGRMLRSEAEAHASAIVEHMKGLTGIKRVEVAGSYRRLKETVGDLDILVTCEQPEAAMERFVATPGVSRVIARGPTRTSLVLGPGLQADMRVVDDGSFGAALQYFTGSQAHSIALRSIAIKKGLKLNEYGVFRDGEKIAGETEEGVYEALGLPWIPPELRENRGEIGLALEGRLPRLVEPGDVRGDLHIHTDATDGRDGLADMVRAAAGRGYLYVAVTNHSKRVTMVGGLDEKGLREHWRDIQKLDDRTERIHVLKGVEVDILDDGSLDIGDDVLALADYVVASVHYNMNMSRSRMTRRLVRAVSHPLVDALAHPTGRIINRRPPYQVNMEDVLAAAARTGTWLELNAAPDRLDIDDVTCAAARKHGIKVSIATDAHSTNGLDFMRWGVYQTRRGALEKADVINTRTYRALMKAIRERRGRAAGTG